MGDEAFLTSVMPWSRTNREPRIRATMSGTHFAEARLTSKAQLTLPKRVKELLGVSEGDYIMFFKDDHRVYIEPGKLTVKPKR